MHTQNLHSKLREILGVGTAMRLHVHLLESMCWQLLFMSACVEEIRSRQVMGLLTGCNSIQRQQQEVDKMQKRLLRNVTCSLAVSTLDRTRRWLTRGIHTCHIWKAEHQSTEQSNARQTKARKLAQVAPEHWATWHVPAMLHHQTCFWTAQPNPHHPPPLPPLSASHGGLPHLDDAGEPFF